MAYGGHPLVPSAGVRGQAGELRVGALPAVPDCAAVDVEYEYGDALRILHDAQARTLSDHSLNVVQCLAEVAFGDLDVVVVL